MVKSRPKASQSLGDGQLIFSLFWPRDPSGKRGGMGGMCLGREAITFEGISSLAFVIHPYPRNVFLIRQTSNGIRAMVGCV